MGAGGLAGPCLQAGFRTRQRQHNSAPPKSWVHWKQRGTWDLADNEWRQTSQLSARKFAEHTHKLAPCC